MPYNSKLFPVAWSNLCPGTQVEEVDLIGDLQNQLLILRSQTLRQSRMNGQSIAELQNSGLLVQSGLYAPIGVGRSFIAGGNKFGALGAQVDKFTHRTESITAQGFELTQARGRHAGVASSSRGYWMGGESNLAGSKLSSVEVVSFDTEQRVTFSTTLTAATSYARGIQSETKGYIGGDVGAGNIGTFSGKIEAITFSSEAIALLGASLPSAVGGCNAVASTTKGYFCSGANSSRVINTLTFSGEATAALSAQLSIPRWKGSNWQSNSKGYFSQGVDPTNNWALSRTIDGFPFGTEAISPASNVLCSFADADLEGVSASRKGFIIGGTVGFAQNIDGFDLTSETLAPISATLTRGGGYCTPVGKP
jgi:hypothetical protein